jgi:hypothetical protein
MTRRFKVEEMSVRRVFKGTITAEDLRVKFNIPKDAEITLTVPGGADWSGMALDISEHPIDVKWEEVK